jgi:hypothetical protein
MSTPNIFSKISAAQELIQGHHPGKHFSKKIGQGSSGRRSSKLDLTLFQFDVII